MKYLIREKNIYNYKILFNSITNERIESLLSEVMSFEFTSHESGRFGIMLYDYKNFNMYENIFKRTIL